MIRNLITFHLVQQGGSVSWRISTVLRCVIFYLFIVFLYKKRLKVTWNEKIMREHKLEDEKGKKIYVNKDTNSSLKKLLIIHKCFQNPIYFLWKELTFFRSAWKLITYKIHQVQNSELMFRKSKILPDVETFFFQRFSQMRYCIMSYLLSSAFVIEIILSLGKLFLNCAYTALEENEHPTPFSGLSLQPLILTTSLRDT